MTPFGACCLVFNSYYQILPRRRCFCLGPQLYLHLASRILRVREKAVRRPQESSDSTSEMESHWSSSFRVLPLHTAPPSSLGESLFLGCFMGGENALPPENCSELCLGRVSTSVQTEGSRQCSPLNALTVDHESSLFRFPIITASAESLQPGSIFVGA